MSRSRTLSRWRNRIQTRLTVYSLLFAVIPVVLVGVLAFYQAQATLIEAASRDLLVLARAAGSDINGSLNERLGDIQVLSQSPILLTTTSTTEEKTEFLLSVQRAYEIYDSLVV